MENENYYYIKLYSNNVFKGKFILKFEDAKQIEYWWMHISRHNSVTYEKIKNNN